LSLKDTLAELRDFDTALIANTLPYVIPIAPAEYYLSRRIQSVTPALGPTVGIALTIELDSSSPAGSANVDSYWQQLAEMRAASDPTVWVVKTFGSRPDHECVLGDGMAKLLHSCGCIGVVTDGGLRDVAGLQTVPFAAYCCGTTIHHEPMRFRNPGKPVDLGGVTIKSGDIIHANHEGVIRIPITAAKELPAMAVKMRAVEHAVHLYWRRTDVSLQQKREHAGKVFEEYGFTATKKADHHELK
jgi:regulator of RNase E activity RraA